MVLFLSAIRWLHMLYTCPGREATTAQQSTWGGMSGATLLYLWSHDSPPERVRLRLQGTLQSDEHFIVWMRTAALPNFRKLYGRLQYDLPAGETLDITIANRHALQALIMLILGQHAC